MIVAGMTADRSERALVRLTVYAAEPRGPRSAWTTARVLRTALELGIAGGTLVAGFEGFGHDHHLHHGGFVHPADQVPVTLIMVDARDRIDGFMPALRRLLPDAVAVVEDVRAIRYTRRSDHRGGPAARPG